MRLLWWRNRAAADRRIFRLQTPSGVKWIDPLPAARLMEAKLGPDWANLAAKLFQPETQAPPGMPPESVAGVVAAEREAKAEAAKRLSDAAADALGLPPLAPDGTGTTERERLTAVVEFVAFLSKLAEDARPFAS